MSTDCARVGGARRSMVRSALANEREPTSGTTRLSRVGCGFRWRCAGHSGPRGAEHPYGPRPRGLALADVHRQHRRRLSGRLLHHPAAGATAVVELSASGAGHRIVRRINDFLHDAGRDAEDARTRPLDTRGGLHRHQHRAGVAASGPGHRFGAPGADSLMTATTVLVWTGVVLIGGIGSVLRFLMDRTITRRVARPFPFGTLAVNISGAALLGFLGGLALSKDAALLTGTAFVGAYTTFSTWMLETQRLGEERRMWAAGANIVVSVLLGIAAALLGQWVAEQIR